MKRRHAFDKKGTLAMRADFWGELFDDFEPAEPFEMQGTAAIVTIEGPLAHHDDWWCDSYDAIKERVGAALASPAARVVLKIDSPGGDVSGCFETVREIRAMAASSGKTILAYTDGMAASAGYALACAASEIGISETAFVGSIGVISTLIDVVEMTKRDGLNAAVKASGRKKLYGHPLVPISEEAEASVQADVDSLAELFFDLVSDARPMSAETVAALEAGMFHGENAVAAKLADRVCTLDELLDPSSANTAANAAEGSTMGWKEDMRKAAEDGDEDAKKGVAALDAEDPPADDDKGKDAPPPKKDDDAADPKEEPAAEDPDPPPPPKKDKDAAVTRLPVNASVERRLAAIEERDERDRLLASRPDIMRDPKLAKKMQTAPIAAVRWNCENLPQVAAPKAATPVTAAKPATSPLVHANAVSPGGTRGADEGGSNGMSRRSDRADEIDRKLGLASSEPHVKHDRNVTSIRLMKPSEARAHVKQLDARKSAEGSK